MKEVKLDKNNLLVDSDGIKFKRGTPVATVECKMTSKDVHIIPLYFEQQILDLQKEGKLEKGLLAVNAYLVANRRSIDKWVKKQRSWGHEEYRIVEACTVELYFLGEQ